jgi:NAD(P)H-flavin reductase
MIILNIRRPILFSFRPGQYACLRVRSIDMHWHPFSIASDPASDDLVFYIEVHGKRSWSEILWNLLAEEGQCHIYRNLDVELMGPYGSPLANISDFSHVLTIGTGTGIVPIISLFKQQVNQLLRLEPLSHFEDIRNHRKKVEDIENAEQSRRGTFFPTHCKMFSSKNTICCHGRG